MDMEGGRDMMHLTKEQQKQLLMLTDTKWKQLRVGMRRHFRLGIDMTNEYTFLLALTSEQWQTVDKEITRLRIHNKDVLTSLRRDTRLQTSRARKTEYMREYMKNYRQRKEAIHGQISNQNSS